MSTEAYYAVVPFVRAPGRDVVSGEIELAPSRYGALRRAYFLVGQSMNGQEVVGAIAVSKEQNSDGVFSKINVIGRYGLTPE
ncbi:hypothetical protein LMIY3S_02000 [Labrys miyagiensis]